MLFLFSIFLLILHQVFHPFLLYFAKYVSYICCQIFHFSPLALLNHSCIRFLSGNSSISAYLSVILMLASCWNLSLCVSYILSFCCCWKLDIMQSVKGLEVVMLVWRFLSFIWRNVPYAVQVAAPPSILAWAPWTEGLVGWSWGYRS